MNVEIGLEGWITVTIRRADGSIRDQFTRQNTINQVLCNQAAYSLFTGSIDGTYAIDSVRAGIYQGAWTSSTGTVTTTPTGASTSATWTSDHVCESVSGGVASATLTTVELIDSSPETVYASHNFNSWDSSSNTGGISGINTGETVSISYTINALSSGSGPTELLAKSIAKTFGGSSSLERPRYLLSDGYRVDTGSTQMLALATIAAAPTCPLTSPGHSSSGNTSSSQAANSNHTATKSSGTIVLRNNNIAGDNDDNLPSMTHDATKAYLSNSSSATTSNISTHSMAEADLSNVKAGDKMDLQFTLTISPSN
jgi:hypothetical protein